MKKTFAWLTTTLLAGTVLAGPESIIYQRAREMRNENNVRQGVAPPTQPTQPATTPTTAPPAPSPGVTKLQTDLAALKAGTPASTEQKQQLTADVLAVAQSAKPGSTATAKLAEDIAAAFTEKPLSVTSRARLVQELDAVLNPAKYPQAKLDGIFGDVQAIFQDNGLARKNAAQISDDVKALSADIQKGGAK